VLAVPSTVVAGLCDRISGAVGGKIVFDPTNPFFPDLSGLMPADTSMAEENTMLLPDTVVGLVAAVGPSADAEPLAMARTLEHIACST
jgi:predicted dinucleotide-binding enzyme